MAHFTSIGTSPIKDVHHTSAEEIGHTFKVFICNSKRLHSVFSRDNLCGLEVVQTTKHSHTPYVSVVFRNIPQILSALDRRGQGNCQGGGEKRNLFSEKTEKTRRKRKRKAFCSFFWNFPYKKWENFSLRKLRKPGEREKEKVVLLFSSTLVIASPSGDY
jgi:hypothetical protein